MGLSTRLAAMTGIIAFVCLLSTRFLPAVPLAASSSIAPITQLLTRAGVNLRHDLKVVLLENDLRKENTTLKSQNASLRGTREQLESHVRQLERAAQIREQQTPAVFVIAPVIGASISPLSHTITVGKGSRDGVQRMMPVSVPEGLVGVVDEVGERSSLVRTITDPRLEIGVTVRGKPKAGRALARGDAGVRLVASGFKKVLLRKGDEIWSANTVGGVFPAAKVGNITEILPTPSDAIGQRIVITAEIDFASLEEVYILRQP